MNHGSHVIVDCDELVDPGAAAVAAARFIAWPVQLDRTALRIEIQEAALILAGNERLPGFRVEHAHQALGQHPDQAR